MKCLEDVDWTILDNCNTVDSKCNLFHSIVTDNMKVIPVCLVPKSRKDKPWITPAIKHLWSAFRNRDFVTYRHLKLLSRSNIAKAKKHWAQKYASPSDLWEKINVSNSRRYKDSLDQLYNSHSINDIFCNNFNDSTCDLMTLTICYIPLTFVILVGISLYLIMMFIKLSQCVTARKLMDRMVFLPFKRNFCICFLYSFGCHFYFCISTSTFPTLCKQAHVILVPKMKNPTIHDLRPIISLLSLPAKFFERLTLSVPFIKMLTMCSELTHYRE